jgi:hypothetical protein
LVPIGANFALFCPQRRWFFARRFALILLVSAAALLGFRSSS